MPRVAACIARADRLGNTRDDEQEGNWQYRGGKQGTGNWRWMDQETSRRLEEAFLTGRETLVLAQDEGWFYKYDFQRMQQTAIPQPGRGLRTIRDIQRVVNEHVV